jgi:hypothetical protein
VAWVISSAAALAVPPAAPRITPAVACIAPAGTHQKIWQILLLALLLWLSTAGSAGVLAYHAAACSIHRPQQHILHAAEQSGLGLGVQLPACKLCIVRVCMSAAIFHSAALVQHCRGWKCRCMA